MPVELGTIQNGNNAGAVQNAEPNKAAVIPKAPLEFAQKPTNKQDDKGGIANGIPQDTPVKQEPPKSWMKKRGEIMNENFQGMRKSARSGAFYALNYAAMPLIGSFLFNTVTGFFSKTPVGMAICGLLGMGISYLRQKSANPDKDVSWREMILGGLTGAFSFGLGKFGFNKFNKVPLIGRSLFARSMFAGATFGASYNGARSANESYTDTGAVDMNAVYNSAIVGASTGAFAGYLLTGTGASSTGATINSFARSMNM